MKLRSVLILLTCILSGFFFACKKNTSATTISKVKTSTNSSNGQSITTTFTYDSLGRLVSEQGDSSTLIYTYTADSLIATFYFPGPLSPNVDIYSLNSFGMVATNPQGSTFTYDAGGHLVREIGGNDTVNNVWVNGNLVLSINSDGAAISTTTTHYGNTIDSRDFGNQVFGKRSTNLPTTSEYTSPSLSGQTQSSMTYQFDGKGRVIQSVSSGSGTSLTFSYTYY